jgi:hypothetical protein
MADVHEICRSHLLGAVAESGSHSTPDVVGRSMLDQIITLWKRERSIEDIRAELEATAENLDPDQDYPFMRP